MEIKLCSIAWFVLFFSIVGIILDYNIFGLTFLGFLLNIIFTVFFVMLANWSCYNQDYNWIAWLIVIISGFGLLGSIYIFKKKDTNPDIYQAILDEKIFREKYGL
jgi:membrane protease YdiL (CAAX protease family)